MPYPSRLSQAGILAVARQVIEAEGVDALTMRGLARKLGVQAPSLYFYVESRDDLLRELIALGLRELGAALSDASQPHTDPRTGAHSLATAYIDFATANPALFMLVFGPCPEERQPPASLGEEASAPVLELAAALVGQERALDFAAVLWSLVHGYTVLRLAEQFRVNPAHEASLRYGLDLLLDAAGAAR